MSSHEAGRTSLDGHGIFAIIVFAVVALICIQPLSIPLPHLLSHAADRVHERLFGTGDKVRSKVENKSQGFVAQAPPAPPVSGGSLIPTKARRYLVFTHVWTPAIGILFLLATKTIGGEQIKVGIVGEEDVEPYDVLALFISLAYIAISLDATGLLRYLAFQVCQKAGSNGYTLYLILFGFFWILGVVVGNDPVILSGTAFLVHLTRVAGISPPSAWIWAQFVAANISSAVLVSSNPTNLVIATGFHITFPVYTAYMLLPSLVSALVSLAVLLLFFRNQTKPKPRRRARGKAISIDTLKTWARGVYTSSATLHNRRTTQREVGTLSVEMSNMSQNGTAFSQEREEERKAPLIYIPPTIIRPDVDARAALVDPKGAIFNSCVMAATLVVLVVTSVFGNVKVYMVAAPGAGVCIIRDIAYDWYTWRSTRKHNAKKQDAEVVAGDDSQNEQAKEVLAVEAITAPALPSSKPQPKPVLGGVVKGLEHFKEVFPTVTYVFARLPFPLLPFAFGMFILVQSLTHVGFVNIMASGIGRVCAGGEGACAVFMSVLSVILCNLGGTNIGATILLTKSLQSSAFQSQLDPSRAALLTRVAYFSVAFGSNVGALGGTFAASLAGLLWRDGLLQRGVVVTKLQFLLWCSVVIVPALLSGVGILLVEIEHFRL